MSRLTAHVAGLVLGGVVGLGALMVYRAAFPWGLLLALVTSLAVLWRLLYSRAPRIGTSYAVGWLVVFGLALRGRPEGDYLLAGDLEGYALVVGALAVLASGVVWLAGGSRRPP